MRLIPKLTFSLVLGMCVVLGINGWLRVRRETEALEHERHARHLRAGAAIDAAMSLAWEKDGERAAVAMMTAVAGGYPAVEARWTSGVPQHARDVTVTTVEATTPPTWRTYVPINVRGSARGEVELSERAHADSEKAQTIVFDTSKTAAALAVLSAFLAFVLGEWIVGKPVRSLTEKARRIGRGDFGAPIALRTRDELAELAQEMNVMASRLAATLDQLRHADRLATVGKLASGLAHELGTPLNVVSARAEMLVGGVSSLDDAHDYGRAIGAAADRMTRIISQLLQFARRKSVHRAVERIDEVVGEAIELLRPLAKKRAIEITCAAERARVSIDRGQVQQVVTNLIMNAFHASPDGGQIRVRVEASRETPPADIDGSAVDALCIVVEDHGTGISPDVLPHIFEPFFTTKDVGEGTGLGLAVSYGIVRDHRGWIAVESSPGRGSRFTVVLPEGALE